MAQTEKSLPVMQETQFWSLSPKDPLEKGIAIHSSILGASLVAQTLKIASRLKNLSGNQDCSQIPICTTSILLVNHGQNDTQAKFSSSVPKDPRFLSAFSPFMEKLHKANSLAPDYYNLTCTPLIKREFKTRKHCVCECVCICVCVKEGESKEESQG